METRLRQAANELPQPQLKYNGIVGAHSQKNKTSTSTHKWRFAFAVILVIACFVTSVYGAEKVQYGLWLGNHSNGYGDVVLLNWQYDCSFPKELCGMPFSNVSTLHGAPEGATHLKALLKPTYITHSISYGYYPGTELENGNIWQEKRITVSFGTTEKEVWRYHFSVDEEGFCDYEGVIPGSQSVTEYEGIPLYLAATEGSYIVRWEDAARKLVFRVHCAGAETEDEVVEIAKMIIDLNS